MISNLLYVKQNIYLVYRFLSKDRIFKCYQYLSKIFIKIDTRGLKSNNGFLIISIAKEAKRELKDAANTETMATLEYMSPESLNHSVYYKESDIYSYGVLAYELIYETDAFKMEMFTLIDAIVNKKYRPEIQVDLCGPKIKNIIENCWKDNWKERCTFDDICKILAIVRSDLRFRENSRTH